GARRVVGRVDVETGRKETGISAPLELTLSKLIAERKVDVLETDERDRAKELEAHESNIEDASGLGVELGCEGHCPVGHNVILRRAGLRFERRWTVPGYSGEHDLGFVARIVGHGLSCSTPTLTAQRPRLGRANKIGNDENLALLDPPAITRREPSAPA